MQLHEFFNQPSELKSEPEEIRTRITQLAEMLCEEHSISKDDKQLTIRVGCLSDKNNLEAISSWVYLHSKGIDYPTEREMISCLKNDFASGLGRIGFETELI